MIISFKAYNSIIDTIKEELGASEEEAVLTTNKIFAIVKADTAIPTEEEALKKSYEDFFEILLTKGF